LPVGQLRDPPEAVGAVAQGSGARNGWTFRRIETKKGLRLIDELRAEIRSGIEAG
jgi:modification methylase